MRTDNAEDDCLIRAELKYAPTILAGFLINN